MEVIKKAFIQIHNKNVPIYGVQSKDLKDFTTTEKDLKKGISRFPLENQRVRSEDLLKIEEKTPETVKETHSPMPTDDYDALKKIRG
jgi:hypothetical protein